MRVLSTLAVKGAFPTLLAQYQAMTGIQVEVEFGPTVALLERLRGGAAADLGILTGPGIDALIGEGIMRPGSRADIAVSFVGAAVKAGAPKPDISTETAFRATLLAAKSIAYSRIGASGLFFAGLIERMEIAAEVNAKAHIVNSLTAELLVSGEAELAIQQVSELMLVPGIEVIGRLPPGIQTPALFSGGLLSDGAEAAAFLGFLASPEAAAALIAAGLDPAQ
jgi:molybdate transport system substrate-binding protein